MSWTRAKLSDLCTDIIDCVNKTAPKSPVETPYKMIRTSDIKDGVINLEGLFSVTEDTFKKWTRRGALQLGDVILTREAPIGEVGIVKEPNNFFLGQRLVLYRTDRRKCDPRFLLYSLMYSENKKAIIAKGSGATVPHLRVPECEKIEISIPDLEMQHRIADILSAYDDLIENNKKQIKLLEEAAQRLYKEWFVDLHFPGYENTKIIDGVPEGWEKRKIGDILRQEPKTEQIKRSEYLLDGDIPVIDQSKNYVSGYTNNCEARIKVNEPKIVFGDHTRILKLIQVDFAKGADGTKVLVSKANNMPQRLFYCSLLNVDLSNHHYARHFKYLKEKEIIVPKTYLAFKFEELVKPIFDKIQENLAIVKNARLIRDKALSRIMNGNSFCCR